MAGTDSKGDGGRSSLSTGGVNRNSAYSETKPKLRRARFGQAKSATRTKWFAKKS